MNKLKYKDILKDLNKLGGVCFRKMIKDLEKWEKGGKNNPVLHFENAPFETMKEKINHFDENYMAYFLERRTFEMFYHDVETRFYLSAKRVGSQQVIALFTPVNEIVSLVIVFN
jgi:hypothetical protein